MPLEAANDIRRVVAGPAEAIAPGQRTIIVPFRGRAGIGVFNVNGVFYALRNLCPHKLGPLCVGRVSGRPVAAAPPSSHLGDPEIVMDGAVLRCPWHLWEFDLTSGQCLVDPQLRVKMYPVAIEDGNVVVYAARADLPVPPPAHSRAMRERGLEADLEAEGERADA